MTRQSIWDLLRPILPGHGQGRRRRSSPPARRRAAPGAESRRGVPTPARPLRPTGNPYLGRACDEGSCGLLDPISQVGEWGLVELDGRECLFCKWCSDRISSLHKGSGMPARVAVVLGEGIVHRMRQPVLL